MQRVDGRRPGEFRVECQAEAVFPGRNDRLGHRRRGRADIHGRGQGKSVLIEFLFPVFPAFVDGGGPARRIVLDEELGVADPERPVPAEFDAFRQLRRRKRQGGNCRQA
ncbi:hypothetical protein SDC9_151054 [bioreactor metagenome]|uniref:Uncharacterized protein n=1 Tax=bioreactor metagenome TaxID=1076179 RepID=A0A645ER48_9ZZZZ